MFFCVILFILYVLGFFYKYTFLSGGEREWRELMPSDDNNLFVKFIYWFFLPVIVLCFLPFYFVRSAFVFIVVFVMFIFRNGLIGG